MKLQIIKRAHGGGSFPQSQERLVSANRRGYFGFSCKCVRELGLTNETRILIAKDEESRNDWYIAFGQEPDGVKLWAQGRPINSYRAQNKAAAIEILDSVKAEKSATFLLAVKPIVQDGIEWYRIMTATPIRKI